MTTPSASELLVQQAQEAERLRLLLLANECKDLDEFRRRLQDLLNKESAGGPSSQDTPDAISPARAASSQPPRRNYSTTAAREKQRPAARLKKFPP